MQVGVVLPSREAAIAGDPSARRLVRLAARAEELGLDSVWAGDAPFARPRFDPLTLLSAIAASTERVSVGTAIVLPVLRQPLLFAHSVATLDRIAEGRLIVGVGAGWVQSEFETVGARFDQRVGRLLETVEICRRLWRSSEPVSFQGRYWSFQDIRVFPEPTRPDGPPIWLGGSSEGTLKRAAAGFDGWFPTSASPEQFQNGWSTIGDLAQGRAITPALYVTVNVNSDVAAAERETADYTLGYYGVPVEAMRQAQDYYAGNADGCVERLRAYLAAGVQHLAVRFATLRAEEQLERFVREVLPALKQR